MDMRKSRLGKEKQERLMEPGGLRGKEVAEPVAKPSSSDCLNVTAKYTQESFLIAPGPHYKG